MGTLPRTIDASSARPVRPGVYDIGLAEDFPDGEQRVFEIRGREIAVFKVDGSFFALRNRCPHQGGPLCDGRVFAGLESDRPGRYDVDDGKHLVACPWHGWEFDLETGRSWFDPQRTRVRGYPVVVEALQSCSGAGSGERQPGPFTAETFPVTVSGESILIDMSQ